MDGNAFWWMPYENVIPFENTVVVKTTAPDSIDLGDGMQGDGDPNFDPYMDQRDRDTIFGISYKGWFVITILIVVATLLFKK